MEDAHGDPLGRLRGGAPAPASQTTRGQALIQGRFDAGQATFPAEEAGTFPASPTGTPRSTKLFSRSSNSRISPIRSYIQSSRSRSGRAGEGGASWAGGSYQED